MTLAVALEAPRLADAAPDVPAALAAVVDRCLAKNAADRYETSGALAEALSRVQSDAATADRERGGRTHCHLTVTRAC